MEVNFREKKTLSGVGQAQARVPTSVAGVPTLAVGAYGLLHLAAVEFAVRQRQSAQPGAAVEEMPGRRRHDALGESQRYFAARLA